MLGPGYRKALRILVEVLLVVALLGLPQAPEQQGVREAAGYAGEIGLINSLQAFLVRGRLPSAKMATPPVRWLWNTLAFPAVPAFEERRQGGGACV